MKKLRNRLSASLSAVLSLCGIGFQPMSVYANPKSNKKNTQNLQNNANDTLNAEKVSTWSFDKVEKSYGEVSNSNWQKPVPNRLSLPEKINECEVIYPLPLPVSKEYKKNISNLLKKAIDVLTTEDTQHKIYALNNGLLCYRDGRLLKWKDILPSDSIVNGYFPLWKKLQEWPVICNSTGYVQKEKAYNTLVYGYKDNLKTHEFSTYQPLEKKQSSNAIQPAKPQPYPQTVSLPPKTTVTAQPNPVTPPPSSKTKTAKPVQPTQPSPNHVPTTGPDTKKDSNKSQGITKKHMLGIAGATGLTLVGGALFAKRSATKNKKNTVGKQRHRTNYNQLPGAF